MGRIQGLTEVYLTGDQLLKTGKGYVFSITVAWVGGTAGNLITLRDGTSGAANPEVVISFDGTNGTITREWSNGKEFETGIFVDFQNAAGQAHVELTYK